MNTVNLKNKKNKARFLILGSLLLIISLVFSLGLPNRNKYTFADVVPPRVEATDNGYDLVIYNSIDDVSGGGYFNFNAFYPSFLRPLVLDGAHYSYDSLSISISNPINSSYNPNYPKSYFRIVTPMLYTFTDKIDISYQYFTTGKRLDGLTTIGKEGDVVIAVKVTSYSATDSLFGNSFIIQSSSALSRIETCYYIIGDYIYDNLGLAYPIFYRLTSSDVAHLGLSSTDDSWFEISASPKEDIFFLYDFGKRLFSSAHSLVNDVLKFELGIGPYRVDILSLLLGIGFSWYLIWTFCKWIL